MARSKKDDDIRRSMCERLRLLTERYLDLTVSGLSEKLGYTNSSALRRVWKGEAFPDVEKLARLAELKTGDGLKPNIHWLLTGAGSALHGDELRVDDSREKLAALIGSMPDEKIVHLIAVLAK